MSRWTVGSTSVPGLAAKPIIDMTVVVGGQSDVSLTIKRLATLGIVTSKDDGQAGIPADRLDIRIPIPSFAAVV